ncbi:MAG: hypothetical protein D6701_04920, partial [Gemmatimonadetes bacterium]
TGKSGASGFGVLVANDASPSVILPSDLSSRVAALSGDVFTAVGRVRRDVGASSTVGVLWAGREGDGYHNRVAGMDANLRLLPALTWRTQVLRSETEDPEGIRALTGREPGGFADWAAVSSLRYTTRNWFAAWDASYSGGGFRADAGFVNQVDRLGTNAWFDRKFWGAPDDVYTVLTVAGGFWHNENLDGRLIGEGLWMNLQYDGPLQSQLWINPNLRRQFFGAGEHAFVQVWFGGRIRPSGSFGFDFNASTGGEIDFANGREARQFRVAPNLALRAGRRIDLRLGHTYQRLNTVDGERIFRANLSQVRAVYNFTARSFLRAIVQVRDTDRNPGQYGFEVNRSDTSVFTQLLFSYKVNPQTVVFVGYSDNRAAFTDRELRDVGLTQASRTLFVKLGYALRP